MDRRTFTKTLPALALGAVGCSERERPAPLEVELPPVPRDYTTSADRAFGVVDGLIAAAESTASGARWRVQTASGVGYPSTLYDGQAGVLAFLAAAYQVRPDHPLLRHTLEAGARTLRSAAAVGGRGLFDGAAGRAHALLAVHRAVGATSPLWLQSALDLAPSIAAGPGGLPGDVIGGPPGQGLFLLELYAETQDTQWLDAVRGLADSMLAGAVESGDGIKIPSFTDPSGVPVCYTGLAHGSAGAGYFLCRLAQALPTSHQAAYIRAAEAIAAWLDGIARHENGEVSWYRREPDQMHQWQKTWCHGPPGIGIFYADLYTVTGSVEYLARAKQCAAAIETRAESYSFACLCHGLSGNAQLWLRLHDLTGDAMWRERADAFGTLTWSRRLRTEYPAWSSGDGQSANNPGLMTGTAGVGWFFLQLAGPGQEPPPGM